MSHIKNEVLQDRLNSIRYFYFQFIHFQKEDKYPLFRWNLEAFIVFARSMTYSIQKEYNKHPDFAEWYTKKRNEMIKNKEFQFFADKRDIIIHEKPTEKDEIKREEQIVGYSDHIPGIKPVFIPGDSKGEYKLCDESTGEEIEGSFTEIYHKYYFKEFPDKQVKEIAGDYLKYLEVLVKEAEDKFESKL